MLIRDWWGSEGGLQPGASLGSVLFSNWSAFSLEFSKVGVEFRQLDEAIQLFDESRGRDPGYVELRRACTRDHFVRNGDVHACHAHRVHIGGVPGQCLVARFAISFSAQTRAAYSGAIVLPAAYRSAC